MSVSYNSAELEKDLNWVRFRIGDTDTNDAQLQDEEIQMLISTNRNRITAAAAAAAAISAKYSRFGAEKEAESFRQLSAQIAAECPPDYL